MRFLLLLSYVFCYLFASVASANDDRFDTSQCKDPFSQYWYIRAETPEKRSKIKIIGEIHGARPLVANQSQLKCWLEQFDLIILEIDDRKIRPRANQTQSTCITSTNVPVWREAVSLAMQDMYSAQDSKFRESPIYAILRARSLLDSTEVTGFEHPEEQLRMLDVLPCDMQHRMLAQTKKDVEKGLLRLSFRALLRAYDGVQADALLLTLNGLGSDDICNCRQAVDKIAFDQRNLKFVKDLQKFTAGRQNILVIVGLGHLLGENAIQVKLAELGFKVGKLEKSKAE